MDDWTPQHKKGGSVIRFAKEEKITRGRGLHNVIAQRLQLFLALFVAVVVDGLFCFGCCLKTFACGSCVCIERKARINHNLLSNDNVYRCFLRSE